MTPISDEQLAAYLDGELAPEARQAVEAAVDADPALAERLAALAAGDQALRAGFSAISDEPVPERLLRALEPARKPAESAPARRLARRRVPRLGLAIAATLMVGAVTALLWPAAGPAPAMTPLQLALEQQLSGEPLVVRNADGTTTDVQVLRTVQRGDGTVCRAYEHTALAAGEVVSQHTGLACRTGDGAAPWVRLPDAGSSPTDHSGDYALAGANSPAGKPLSEREEQALIEAGWDPKADK